MKNPQVGHTPAPSIENLSTKKKFQTEDLKLTCTRNKIVK
jgi:hypothetical protein